MDGISMLDFIISAGLSAWELLLDASVYMLVGLMFGGLLHAFLNPETISNHLGKGRFKSVFKAAIMGIPLPLCSCGVLPAAVSLKKQGANNGATTAFLISTPESGVDSISVTYALLDPIITVVRPVAAFFMAMVAGIMENILPDQKEAKVGPDKLSPVLCKSEDMCCASVKANKKMPVTSRLWAGLVYSFTTVWSDMAGWFFIGLVLAGFITALIPEQIIGQYLGGGILSMLLMLAMGIPLYICATASTPVAAALILKGVSPGAAVVFLLAGPATNITSLTVLTGVLGKRTTIIYLCTIAIFSVIFGMSLDLIYAYFGISSKAIIGTASEIIPQWIQISGVVVLIIMSVKPLYLGIKGRVRRIMNRNYISVVSDENKEAALECKGST